MTDIITCYMRFWDIFKQMGLFKDVLVIFTVMCFMPLLYALLGIDDYIKKGSAKK